MPNPDEFVEILLGDEKVSLDNPFPVAAEFAPGTMVDITGTDAQPGGNDITVDGTAGGVLLLAANASRRSAMIQNTGSDPMRVGIGEAPDSNTGFILQSLDELTTDAQDEIRGIRTTANSTTAFAQEFI